MVPKTIKEMVTSIFISLILAIVLPSLRISPCSLNRAWLVAMGILAIALLYAAALSFNRGAQIMLYLGHPSFIFSQLDLV